VSLLDEQVNVPELREALRQLPGPYLIRRYEATLADYEQISDEDLKCEYVDGELIVHSPASIAHERLVTFISTLINLLASSRNLGEVYGSNAVMQLGRRRFSPDVSFLTLGHKQRVRAGQVRGPMDLAVEVLSASTRRYDLEEKRPAYRAGRVPEVWLIDPQRKVFEADVLAGGRYTSRRLTRGRFRSRVLPGFALDVTWLWSDPLPNPLDCLR